MGILNQKFDMFCVDISDLSFKVSKLQKDGKFFSLQTWGNFKIPKDVILDGEIKNENTLKEILSSSFATVSGKEITAKNIAMTLPEDKTFTRIVPYKKMDWEDAKDYIKLEAEKFIPIPLDQVYLDIQKVEGLNLALFSAIPKDIANSYALCFKEMGYQPLIFEPKSMAVARSLIKGGVSEVPVLILDLGARRTHLTIFYKNCVFYTVSINLSANNLTQEIAIARNIDFKTAEDIKKKNKEDFSKTEDKYFNELFKEIDKYLEFYTDNSPKEASIIKKIILTGGGSNLKGIENRFDKHYSIESKVGDVWINILEQPIKKIPGISFSESNLYSAALGLSLRSVNFDI